MAGWYVIGCCYRLYGCSLGHVACLCISYTVDFVHPTAMLMHACMEDMGIDGPGDKLTISLP
jgi:hypothetical protein